MNGTIVATPPGSAGRSHVRNTESDMLRGRRFSDPLTRDHVSMTQGTNAGVKRNRLATGTTAKTRKVYLDPTTDAELSAVCTASGNVSRSLYLEQLLALVQLYTGACPVSADPRSDGGHRLSRRFNRRSPVLSHRAPQRFVAQNLHRPKFRFELIP